MRWSERFPNFEPEEVLSAVGMSQYRQGNLLVEPRALDALQALRRLLDCPLTVNFEDHQLRGYRSPSENSRIDGSVMFSRHVQGIAFDVSCKYSVEELAKASKEIGFNYVKEYRTWVHMDMGVRNDDRNKGLFR